jgi:hypothetical protein
MRNLERYRDMQHWSAGPHLFVADHARLGPVPIPQTLLARCSEVTDLVAAPSDAK